MSGVGTIASGISIIDELAVAAVELVGSPASSIDDDDAIARSLSRLGK